MWGHAQPANHKPAPTITVEGKLTIRKLSDELDKDKKKEKGEA